LYEKKGHIALMTWNRPEKRNCFTPEMIDAFYEAFGDFDKDPNLYVAILAGTGDKSWCAGGDLDAMIPAITSGKWKVNEDPTKRVYHDIFKPIICAVNGFATLELVQGADLVVASENASFTLGEVRWGMIAAGGSHVRLPRYMPWWIAMETLLLGRPLPARRAYVRAWNHEPAYVLENLLFQRVRESEDAKEGPRAYMERRKPQFKGR